jgi:hypothetical protein
MPVEVLPDVIEKEEPEIEQMAIIMEPASSSFKELEFERQSEPDVVVDDYEIEKSLESPDPSQPLSNPDPFFKAYFKRNT